MLESHELWQMQKRVDRFDLFGSVSERLIGCFLSATDVYVVSSIGKILGSQREMAIFVIPIIKMTPFQK
jgi:hypothetical protein